MPGALVAAPRERGLVRGLVALRDVGRRVPGARERGHCEDRREHAERRGEEQKGTHLAAATSGDRGLELRAYALTALLTFGATMADGSVASRRGAECSGEIDGLGWRVFRVHEHGRTRFVLVAYVAEGIRRKMRLPVDERKLVTPELRARFAKGCGCALIRNHTDETAPLTSKRDPGGRDVRRVRAPHGRPAISPRCTPGHARSKFTIDGDIQRLDFMKPLVGNVPLREFRVEHAERVLAALSRERSDATRRHYAQTIRRVLALACYPGKIIDRHRLPANFLPRVGPGRAKSFLYPSRAATCRSSGAFCPRSSHAKGSASAKPQGCLE